MGLYNAYKDDGNRMCELLLSHNERKVDYLSGQLRNVQNENSALLCQSKHVTDVYNDNMMQAEMTDEQLPQFAGYVDNIYYNAWVDHYIGFHPNTPLLDNSKLIDVYKLIEGTFPCHYRALRSVMYGKRSNEPKRANTKYNQDKRHVLVHYFLCLIREHDRHQLLHWAMVATVVLHYRGADNSSFRNHVGRAATIDFKVALEKLDTIFEERAPNRMEVLSSQKYVTNLLDNYNRFQKFSTQRCGAPGVFHNGIVYSAICVHECNKPVGTLMTHLSSNEQIWKVAASALSPTFEYCNVFAELLDKNTDGTYTPTGLTCTVSLPNNDWRATKIPGHSSEVVTITYHDQAIPTGIRMNVPSDLSNQALVMSDCSWMATIDGSAKHRSLGVREYVNLVRKSRVLLEILSQVQQSTRKHCNVFDHQQRANINEYYHESTTRSYCNASNQRENIDHKKCSTIRRSLHDCIEKNHPHLRHHISQHQKHFLEYFNESYHAVSKYMWMTLAAKDEMNKDELFLALIEILVQLGFVNDSSGITTVLDGYELRRIFQYGDVLTVQKLHQLNPLVLKRMTHIGHYASVRRLYALLTNTTLRSHDYLHENIYRLQALYKVYFPGFIEVCCAVISAKRVTYDPTKGTWRDHEQIVIKLVSALKRIQFEVFLSRNQYECNLDECNLDECNPDSDSIPNFLWTLSGDYEVFCASLRVSNNENTRYIALFLDFAERWDRCRNAVRVGDWATLEVEAIDWLPVWGALKKPQYQIETMRRMRIMYGMTADELEHYRMNHFFRMHPNGNFMSYDDFCEKHNYALKQCSNHPDIQVMCQKSRHLHAASRCAKLLFGYEGKTQGSKPNAADDIDALYNFSFGATFLPTTTLNVPFV